MPRENRKRGKKHKKQREEEPSYDAKPERELETREEPSWIVPAANHAEEVNPEAPFGYVDVDVKAYFRTVDVQIQEWQENQEESAADEDVDPNERMSAKIFELKRDANAKTIQKEDCSSLLL